MAQEKSRAVRTRKTTKGESGAAAPKTEKPKSAPKASGPRATPKKETEAVKRPRAPRGVAGEAKTAARKTAAKAPARRRATLVAVPEPTPEEIAFHAYLLWEQGAPGDETEHWLRAEAELRAA